MNQRTALGAAVLALLALALVRGSGGGPPLYDGVCLPPQYTMYGAHPAPPSRSQTFTATDLAGTFELADNDTTPQAQIIVGAGSLAPAPGSSDATVSITPIPPPSVKPTDGTIDGNVYDFQTRSGGQAVQVKPGHLVTVVLSATRTGGSQFQVEHFDGKSWSAPAKSVASGCGTTYQVNSATLGAFALVGLGGTSTGNGSGGGGFPIVIVVVVLLALAVIIGGVRMSRQRNRGGRRRR